jgi:hypothetical protein
MRHRRAIEMLAEALRSYYGPALYNMEKSDLMAHRSSLFSIASCARGARIRA